VPVTSATKPLGKIVLGKPLVSKVGLVELTARSHVPGVFRFVARIVGSRAKRPYASGKDRSSGTRPVTLVLATTPLARSALAHHRHLRIRVQVTFAPSAGGKSLTSSKIITI
jgi:hypothetical protein